jgi:hypothetical protein
MSFFDAIRALWAPKGGHRGKRLYLVDAGRLLGSGSGGERVSPREQVQVLQQLSRFAEKEGIGVEAVFEGRALREVANGEEFGKVTVFFAEKASDLPGLLIQRLRAGLRRSGVTVITSNSQVEKEAADLGGSTMRPSTFRRAMENGQGGGDRDRGGDRGDRDRGGRGRRHRPQGRAPRPQQPPPQQQPSQPQEPSSGAPPGAPPADSSKDSVRDLIDLVE